MNPLIRPSFDVRKSVLEVVIRRLQKFSLLHFLISYYPGPTALHSYFTHDRFLLSTTIKMPYSILLFAYRKPGVTPEQFKSHYDGTHMPLVRELAGAHFPLSHTRRYIHRSENQADGNTARNSCTPATVIIGTQKDFDYDAVAELTFEDEAAFHTFYGIVEQPENAAKIAADEENFLDRSRLTAVVVGDTTETRRLGGDAGT
ncbi:EthD domain-containing protein [Nemania serpens]|nr:EthD domain-containing protein [Nemania serpens]